MKLVPAVAVIRHLNQIIADDDERAVILEKINRLVGALEFWEEACPLTLAPTSDVVQEREARELGKFLRARRDAAVRREAKKRRAHKPRVVR